MSFTLDYSDNMAKRLYVLFLAVLEVHAPLKRRMAKMGHAHAPWISPNIKKLVCERYHIKERLNMIQHCGKDINSFETE